MTAENSTETRQRILQAATELFAGKGFAQTSTREIARHANVNIASLHYHFGDKADLYRTVFNEFSRRAQATAPAIDYEKASFAEIYTAFNRQFFAHLTDPHLPRLAARERLEPSGVLGDAWLEEIRRRHQSLDHAIARELGLAAADVDVQRLTFAVIGMVVPFDHARPIMDAIAPELTSGEGWIETTLSHLTTYAQGMIEAERKRRSAASEHSDLAVSLPCLP